MARILWKKDIWYCSKFKRLISSLFVPLAWAKGNTIGSNPNWWDLCIRSTLYLKPGTQAIRTWLQGEGQEGTRIEICLGPNRTQEPIIHSASHNLGNPIPRYGRTCKCSHPCKPAFHQTSRVQYLKLDWSESPGMFLENTDSWIPIWMVFFE